eukprot:scaffold1535_cov382-Prasinococcus_capsulatus_cf.AAC.21
MVDASGHQVRHSGGVAIAGAIVDNIGHPSCTGTLEGAPVSGAARHSPSCCWRRFTKCDQIHAAWDAVSSASATRPATRVRGFVKLQGFAGLLNVPPTCSFLPGRCCYLQWFVRAPETLEKIDDAKIVDLWAGYKAECCTQRNLYARHASTHEGRHDGSDAAAGHRHLRKPTKPVGYPCIPRTDFGGPAETAPRASGGVSWPVVPVNQAVCDLWAHRGCKEATRSHSSSYGASGAGLPGNRGIDAPQGAVGAPGAHPCPACGAGGPRQLPPAKAFVTAARSRRGTSLLAYRRASSSQCNTALAATASGAATRMGGLSPRACPVRIARAAVQCALRVVGLCSGGPAVFA